jgi:hypothetical protein
MNEYVFTLPHRDNPRMSGSRYAAKEYHTPGCYKQVAPDGASFFDSNLNLMTLPGRDCIFLPVSLEIWMSDELRIVDKKLFG